MSVATLNDLRAITARANIPKWGRWYADVTLDAEHILSGRVTMKITDLTLSGTIVSGASSHGRASYCLVGGAGWGQTVKAKSYSNDASERAATILGDAAREVGETLGPIDPSLRVGANFTRTEGPACDVLELIAPRGWYVDEAGITRLGQRAPGALVGKVTTVTPLDARGKVVLAAESIATILPGVVVEGMTAVDVLHEVSATGGLRSTVWGPHATSPLDSLAGLLETLDPDRPYRGVTEYRVDTANGKRLNLQPVQVSSGMPYLKNVPIRPGVAGCEADVALGSRVLVGFVNSDRSRPYVAGFEDADGDHFVPTSLKLAGGSDFVALAAKVDALFKSIATCPTTGAAGDGAALKASLVSALSTTPSVAATKVKAS